METVLIIIGLLVIYGVGIYFISKWMRYRRHKDMIRVTNEMVESGEITREDGDAIIWLINKVYGKVINNC